jgi:hypothetical protein
MIVGKAIYYLLTNATDVTDIVSTRVYPEIAQQDATLPYIVYAIANNEPTDTKPEPSKLDTAQIEVNIYSDSYRQAIDLAVAVRATLDRVKGTYSGVDVQSIQYLNEVIDFDEPQRAYNISADYDVRISRSGFEIAQGSPITGVELGELSDVDVTGVTNGQLIAYNSTSGNWEAADDAGGAETLDDLTDVDAGQPDTGQLLVYGQDTWETIGQDELELPIGSVTGLQGELDSKAESLNDLSDVTISGTPTGNQALIYDATASVFRSTDSFTNRFEDDVERGSGNITPFVERAYGVKSDGDGIFIDNQSDTPSAGKVIKRKIYHKAGIITDTDVIGDYTLIHTFDDDTAYSATESTFEGFRDGDTYGTPPYTLIQTWDEEDAAPAFTGLLNESYGSGAEAAYSTRRLNGNVTECMVIRRASDSTTTTIGFDSEGNIDESAIETFCTGTTCTVSEWKDQSGNDNTATASGTEPTIYTGGALVKENGRVVLHSTNDPLNTGLTVDTSAVSFIMVGRHLSGDNGWFFGSAETGTVFTGFGVQTKSTGDFRTYYGDGSTFNVQQVGKPASLSQYLFFQSKDTAGWDTSVNGQVFSKSPATDRSTTGTLYLRGQDDYFQEFIVYLSEKSTDRTSIEENIGDYFTQNTPLLDTYTGAAAAYSLRKLRTAYTGDAVEVYNGSSYADIGWNVFGELDTVALAAHCGSNDGFVSKWYCQSGNGNDAVQTTTANMPKIYDGTTGVVTENGKPAMELDGTGDGFNISSAIAVGSQKYTFTVHSIDSSDGQWTIFSETVSTDLVPIAQSGSSSGIVFGYTLNALYKDGGTAFSGTRNDLYNAYTSAGQSLTTIDFSGDGVGNFFRRASFETNGTAQEIVIYSSDQSSNRTNIEDNINTFYSIY